MRGQRLKSIARWAFVCGFVPAVAAVAQPSRDIADFERQLEQFRRDSRIDINPSVPVGQRLLFKYGGYYTFSYFSLDGSDGDTRILRQHDLVGYARLNIDGVHDFSLRGRATYQDFHRGDDFDENDDDDEGDLELERLIYRFDAPVRAASPRSRVAGTDLSFQVGRDLTHWANGLVLSQVLDGGAVDVSYGDATLRLMAGITEDDTVDFDVSRPNFDETRRAFYGALLGYRHGNHRPFVYALWQRDENDDDPINITSPVGPPLSVEFEYNSYYLGAGLNGAFGDRLAYAAELVYEGGEALSSVAIESVGSELIISPQQQERISAFAADLRLDYLFPDERQTRLSGEIIVASGDDDRLHTTNTFGGNRPGTTDHAFNALGLVNTGIAFNPDVSNLALVRLGLSAFPAPDVGALRQMQVGLDLFAYGKFLSDAPIDEPTTDDGYLGFETDLFLNWRITSDATLAIRYGVFFPGTAVVSDDEPRHAFYTGVTFAF